jgi:DNA-binding response OmpR family regulator
MDTSMAWNILLVEADVALADEIRQAVGPAGFQVSVLESGEAAVERGRAAAPDLILLSAELPDMSGFSVCNRLKRTLPSIPLILYTREAVDGAIEAHRASRGRADAYLRAPPARARRTRSWNSSASGCGFVMPS